jgi:hypothetical protein
MMVSTAQPEEIKVIQKICDQELNTDPKDCIDPTSSTKTALDDESEKEHTFSRCVRYCIFIYIISFEITNNLENGTIPAAIYLIQKSLNISSTEIGIFGSLSYFGNTLGSLLAMWSLYKINRKWLLIIHMLLSGLFLFAFTLTKNIPYLYFNRIKVGIVQVFI